MRASTARPSHLAVLGYLKHPTVIRLTLIYFLAVCGSYGFGLWLPTMLKQLSGLGNTQVSLLAALPVRGLARLRRRVLLDVRQDRQARPAHRHPAVRHGARPVHRQHLARHGLFWVMFGFCVVGAGVYTHIPSFWSLPGKQLSGTAAAVSVGIINSFGNLGGFVGPYLMGWLQTHTGSFVVGISVLLCFQVLAGILVLSGRGDRAGARA